MLLTMCSISYAATYYMPGDFSNLQAAFADMEGGDTLIIRNGVYTGDNNVFNTSIPTGTPAAWTTIKAENDGEAIFDGEFTRNVANLVYQSGQYNPQYIRFEGLVFKNTPACKCRCLLCITYKIYEMWICTGRCKW